MAKDKTKQYSDEALAAARKKLAEEHGVPESLAVLATGQSPEEIEAGMKALGELVKQREPAEGGDDERRNGKPEDEDKPPEGTGKFDPEIFDQMLDKLIGRFGPEAVQQHLAKRLGMDKITETVAGMQMEGVRKDLALEYKLTPEQAAAIPGSTPEELQRNMKWAVEQAEAAAQQRPAGAQSGASGRIPARTITGGGPREVKSVEEAEELFDGVPSAYETRQR